GARPVPPGATGAAGRPPPGPVGPCLGVLRPFGGFPAGQWRELTRAAAAFPPGELRLTPWRGVVVPAPGAEPDRAASVLARLAAAGLVPDAGSPRPPGRARARRPGRAASPAGLPAARA